MQLHGAKSHPVPGAEMARLHLDDDLAQFDASHVASTKIQDSGVLVDGLGPTGELPAETDELFFRVGKVAAFHEVDRQINGCARVRSFLIEPAFPDSCRGQRGRILVRKGQAIRQFLLCASDDQLEESRLLLRAIAGFKIPDQLAHAVPMGPAGLRWRRNEFFV